MKTMAASIQFNEKGKRNRKVTSIFHESLFLEQIAYNAL